MNSFDLFKASFSRNYPGFSDEVVYFLYRKYGTAAEAFRDMALISTVAAGELIRSHLEGDDVKEWLSQWEWYAILDHEIIFKEEWHPYPDLPHWHPAYGLV